MRLVTAALLLLCACTPMAPTFNSDDGVSLAYALHVGETGKPAIILLHILGGTRNDWAPFAKALNDLNYTTLAYDQRGQGHSGGQLRLGADYAKMITDVGAAKRFLASQNISTNRLVIIGASIGANVAINYAATDPDVKGIALLSPGFDYRGIKTLDVAQNITIPTFYAASPQDMYAYNSSTQLAAATKGVLVSYDNAGHGTAMFSTTDLQTKLLDWIKTTVATS